MAEQITRGRPRRLANRNRCSQRQWCLHAALHGLHTRHQHPGRRHATAHVLRLRRNPGVASRSPTCGCVCAGQASSRTGLENRYGASVCYMLTSRLSAQLPSSVLQATANMILPGDGSAYDRKPSANRPNADAHARLRCDAPTVRDERAAVRPPASPTKLFELFELLFLPEPPVGIEPTTCSLRVNRSAD